MNITNCLKKSNLAVAFLNDLRIFLKIPHLIYRPIAVSSYLRSSNIKKLQIGSGPTSKNTWLCTDIDPIFSKIIYLDATKPFPFNDSAFDYIFSEHMIEHISYEQGLAMLRECYRVLKPKGVIRITTPDLEVLLGLYSSKLNPIQMRYIQWISDRDIGVGDYKASFVINNAFRNWGHQFLYDYDLLNKSLREAGFINIKRQNVGESEDENLRRLETHGENIGDEEINSFETMVLEGTCSK